MNAHAIIAADSTDASIVRANGWVANAKPMLRLAVALDELEWTLARQGENLEVSTIIANASREAFVLIEDARAEALYREQRCQDLTEVDTDDAWNAAEEHDKRLAREVTSVECALRECGL